MKNIHFSHPYLAFLLCVSYVTFYVTNALSIPAPVVHTACGFVAGSAGAIAAYPIDYVKSQLQTEAGRAKYSGGLQVAYEIVKEDGIRSLYRGVAVNIVGIAPEKTIKLSVNEAARLAIAAQLGGSLPLAGEMLAGAIAGMTQVVVTNPLEVVKVKMQTSDMTIKETLSEIRSFMDLYQGAGACVVRDMIFSAVLFPAYAHAKVAIVAALVALAGSSSDVQSVSFWSNMVAGSAAAAPAALLATPPDVIKTRLQQSRQEQVVFVEPQVETQSNNLSGIDVLKTVIREEGVSVLFSGWFERVVRSAPQFGVTLAVFDVLNVIAIEHGWMSQ